MSELKVYHHELRYNEYEEFYLKYEADEVIAGLQDKLQKESALLKETRDWLIESQKMHKRCADNAIKIIRHQKYKRCLGIAKWCFEKSYSTTLVKYDKKSGLLRNFYDWWGYHWLELAEKFKEAKQ